MIQFSTNKLYEAEMGEGNYVLREIFNHDMGLTWILIHLKNSNMYTII